MWTGRFRDARSILQPRFGCSHLPLSPARRRDTPSLRSPDALSLRSPDALSPMRPRDALSPTRPRDAMTRTKKSNRLVGGIQRSTAPVTYVPGPHASTGLFLSLTPALSKVAISQRIFTAPSMTCIASAAPVPSPSRISRSSKGCMPI